MIYTSMKSLYYNTYCNVQHKQLFMYIRPTSCLYFAAFCQHLINHVMMMMMNKRCTLNAINCYSTTIITIHFLMFIYCCMQKLNEGHISGSFIFLQLLSTWYVCFQRLLFHFSAHLPSLFLPFFLVLFLGSSHQIVHVLRW